MMYSREVAEYYLAKHKAAKRCSKGWVKPADLPSNAEIRDQVQMLARMHEGPEQHAQTLLEMRVRALWWMRKLRQFHPKLIGSVLTGAVRKGSDIDLHLYAANPHSVTIELDDLDVSYELQRKRVTKAGQQRVYTHIHVRDQFPIELTIYHPSQLGFRFKSSITNKPIENAGLSSVERLIALEHGLDQESQLHRLSTIDTNPDRYHVFQSLLVPLEAVHQSPKYHPEGDALFHSLQVFSLGRDAMPYDEEFLLAALLHDVGKAIDPDDHVAAGLEALDGFISDRTAWLIGHHMEAHKIRDHSLGARRKRRLSQHAWYDDLCLLGQCDREGRVPGAEVDELDQALDYIESIEEMFGG